MSDTDKLREIAEQATDKSTTEQTDATQELAVKVDEQTYLTLQLAKFDDEIAALKLSVSQIQQKIAQLEKNKTQAIMDFHYSMLKAQTEKSNDTEKV